MGIAVVLASIALFAYRAQVRVPEAQFAEAQRGRRSARRSGGRAGNAPPLAVRHVEEAQDEERGQQVDEPVHLAEFAAQDLQ